MKILIGSNNPGKVNEFKNFLQQFGIEVVTPHELGITESPEEIGTTFEDNALLKAKFYQERSGLPVLSDDGGIEIDALNGAPGVKSRRWKSFAEGLPEYEMTDQELVDYTLEKLQGVPEEKRTAHLTLRLCYLRPGAEPIFVKKSIDGRITDKQDAPIIPGYPFRSIFLVDKIGKLYAELTHEEHEAINHRHEALEELRKYL